MLKALLKKQFMEMNAGNLTKKKKKSSKISPFARTVLLYVFIAVFVGAAFYILTGLFAESFLIADIEALHWLYFAFLGVGATLFGAFGSVLQTFSTLYKSKDNELLLSMPIPPSKILFVRVAAVFVMSLFYSALMWIPAVIRYAQCVEPPFAVTFVSILLIIPVALFVTVLSCIAGWVVALISGKLRNRNIVTVIIGLVIFGIYYLICFRLYDIIQRIALNAENIGNGLKIWAYPISQLAYGAIGSVVSAAIFTAIAAAAFAVCYIVLSKSFIKIITTNKGIKKAVYREKAVKQAGVKSALLRREMKHFTGNASYMLNCGLGLVMILVIAVIVLFNAGNIRHFLGMMETEIPMLYNMIPVIITAFICLLSAMVYITAPSVSLEGRSIWLAHSLPVRTLDVLYAKEKMHIYITLGPVVISALIMGIVFRYSVPELILSLANAALYVIFNAGFGLKLNLKHPKLDWTNESQPIKNGMPAVVSLFGGWGICMGTGALYLLAQFVMPPAAYMAITAAALALVIWLNDRWMRRKGVRIFRDL